MCRLLITHVITAMHPFDHTKPQRGRRFHYVLSRLTFFGLCNKSKAIVKKRILYSQADRKGGHRASELGG